ncbi:MAG: hypothetical protein WAV40_03605, partial [Microgenomates group bacterium]
MKKLLFLQFRTFVIMFAFSLISYVQPVSAKVMFQEQGAITIPANQTIDDDLFIAGESVAISGNIKGDVFVGTGNLTLTHAIIEGSLIVGAGNVTIDKDSKIGGSLIVGAGNLTSSAPVGRNVMAGAGSIYLNSKVGKEARLGAGNIELGPLTSVTGDLTYALGEDTSTIKQDPSSTISGSVTRYTPPVASKQELDKAKQDLSRFGTVARSGWLLISFIGSLLVGFLILKLFPKTSQGLASQVSTSLMPSLGIGFLIIVASVPVFLVLCLTIIGLPLAGLLFLLFCLELHLAKLVASFALGQFVAKIFNWNKIGIYTAFALGLA